MPFPPVEEQLRLIRRGTESIVPEPELADRLKTSRETGTPLRIKYGIDPTGIDLHLGHTVPMRKMRQFQRLGHQAVIIIGNYTALVGDPSGRDEARARLSPEQVERNAEDYLAQLGKVIDLDAAEIVRNGDWFAPLSFAELLELCSSVTIAQMLTRDDFAKRYKAESPIYLHECLYPIMQAFDSVVVGADVELGGTEQLYSFMLARDFQKHPALCRLAEKFQSDDVKHRRRSDGTLPPQIGVMSPILVGLDGVRRMGKSLGNYIGISEPAYDMMWKTMRIDDTKEQENGTILHVMRQYFELLTDIPLDEVDRIIAEDPKGAKLRLAKQIVCEYHDRQAAEAAAQRWEREVNKKQLPDEIQEELLHTSQLDEEGRMSAAHLLKELGLVPSTSEAMRRIAGGAVHLWRHGKKHILRDRKERVFVTEGMIVRCGKKAKDHRIVRFMDRES